MRLLTNMTLRNKTLVLVSLIILIMSLFSGNVEGFKEVNSPMINSVQEEGKKTIHSRKLSKIEAVMLDYDDAEPNPRHDPRRKRSNP